MKKDDSHKTIEWQKAFSISWNTIIHNLKSTGIDLSKVILVKENENLQNQ